MRRTIVGFLVATALIAMAAPVLAGGWATVRLDEPPGDVLVDVPWTVGFMVLQHDVTPSGDVSPVVRATHKETAEEVMAIGRPEGATGHFVAEVTFPRSGEWKWAIQPEPYAETSFETLNVLAGPSTRSYQAHVLAGSCADPGDVVFPLGDAHAQGMGATSSQRPIAVSVSTIGTTMPKLVAGGHAISIGGDGDAIPIACGDIEASADAAPSPEEMVLGLQDQTGEQNVGAAILRDEGEQTAVTLYLLNPYEEGSEHDVVLPAADDATTVDILDTWFAPASLEAAVGETVTWVNTSAIAHTVTGDDLAFDNSGLLDPGDSFSIAFDEPGTYRYRCGPHPTMVGEIVVT